MEIEAGLNMDEVDESFLNEGMTIAFETPNLAVRKLYYDILIFSRTDRRYIQSVDERVNEILAFAKDVENQITDRRIASNDIIEYKENRSWILKCYKLWLRACLVKSLNPKVMILKKVKKQFKNN
jgi:hypothetical protein